MQTSKLNYLISKLTQKTQIKSTILKPQSRYCRAILTCLCSDGWIERWNFVKVIKESNQPIRVSFKMFNTIKVINEIVIISKPGRKVYLSIKELENHAFSTNTKSLNRTNQKRYSNTFFDTWVLSTPKGILTRKEALKQKVGGELLFCIR